MRRHRCATPGCGRTRSERAGDPSFRLGAGAEPVEAPELDGEQVSRYTRFLLYLRGAYARGGLPEAIRAACDEVDVARSTATRWLTRSVEDGFPEEVLGTRQGAELRAAVHLYRASWPAPQPDRRHEIPAALSVDATALGPTLRFARWLASVVRGDRTPSWPDRLWRSDHRLPGGSNLASTWRRVEGAVSRFGEARTPSSGEPLSVGGRRDALVEVWDADETSSWLSTRILGPHPYKWLGRRHGALRRPTTRYHRTSAAEFLERQMPERLTVSMGLTSSLESWCQQARRRVEPGRLREEDLRLDRTLRYWMRSEPGRWVVVVATRRRTVGKATHRDDAVDEQSPWIRLRPERREEDPSTGRVALPADGLEQPLVLAPSDDAVLAPSP